MKRSLLRFRDCEIGRSLTEGDADVVVAVDDRPQVLHREDDVADRQGGDRGHHRLVLEFPQLRQYHVDRQGGDQEDGRDDADDADQHVLPHHRDALVHQLFVET